MARVATGAFLASVAISSVRGQATHTNFAGTWLLDYARSDSSSFTPKSATWTVIQQGDSIVLNRESPSGKQQAIYALNGTPHKFTLRLIGTETEATSTVTWTGSVMVVHTVSHPGDTDLVQNDTWALSADGKELRVKREANSPGMGLGAPTFVFVRKS